MNRKVYFRVSHGMGDAIAHFFCKENYGTHNEKSLILPRIKRGQIDGLISEAAAVVQSYTAGTIEIFRAVDCALHIAGDSSELQNRWEDVTESPGWFRNIHCDGPITLPTTRPHCLVPDHYVLFTDMASSLDRCLTNHLIYYLISGCTKLPVVKVGNAPHWHSEVPADIDLYRKTTISETAWLAQHARLIVSAPTWMRTMSSVFKVPVIEIAEDGRIEQQSVERTKREYAGREYGINHLNKWFHFPSQNRELEYELKTYRI